jgi:hypothetical protein
MWPVFWLLYLFKKSQWALKSSLIVNKIAKSGHPGAANRRFLYVHRLANNLFVIGVTKNPYWSGRLRTAHILVLTSLDQLHLIIQTLQVYFLQIKLPLCGGEPYWAFPFCQCFLVLLSICYVYSLRIGTQIKW